MRKIQFLSILLLLYGFANNNDLIERNEISTDSLKYVLGFSNAFDDFEILTIEYIKNTDFTYVYIKYRGYYPNDIEFLNIQVGDLVDSHTLCQYDKKTNLKERLNGSDVFVI